MILETKESGLTMKQTIDYYKEKYNVNKMCFCGRLDPMARGKIILLTDKECKDMNKYNKFNKTYEFEIVIGIKTASDDPLGLIEDIDITKIPFFKLNQICYSIINEFQNYPLTFNQKFHKYSSKCINGKPLWYYTKHNIDIEQPTHNVSIFDIQYKLLKFTNYESWKHQIINTINKIDKDCDFNQSVIINQWNNINIEEIISIPVKITVSSGFYVRQFVRDLSDKINYPLLTYDINRISFNV